MSPLPILLLWFISGALRMLDDRMDNLDDVDDDYDNDDNVITVTVASNTTTTTAVSLSLSLSFLIRLVAFRSSWKLAFVFVILILREFSSHDDRADTNRSKRTKCHGKNISLFFFFSTNGVSVLCDESDIISQNCRKLPRAI